MTLKHGMLHVKLILLYYYFFNNYASFASKAILHQSFTIEENYHQTQTKSKSTLGKSFNIAMKVKFDHVIVYELIL